MEEVVSVSPQPDFPEKPVQQTAEQNPYGKSVFSILLFIVAGYFFFGQSLKYTLFLVVVIFIHEMGHFIAMKAFGYKDVKMFFIPLLGALVSGQKHEVSQKQKAITLLAGPVPGIVIGIILYAIGLKNESKDLELAGGIFLFLNIFNLFPVTPFDGGSLIETLFFSAKETIQTIFVILSAIVIAAFSIYSESYVMLLIPVVLVMRIYQQSKNKKIKAALDAQGVEYNKTYEELTNREYWLIRAEIIKANATAFNDASPTNYMVSAREHQLIDLVKSLASNKLIADLSGLGKGVFTAIWLFFCIAPVIILALMMVYFRPPDLTEVDGWETFNADFYGQTLSDCIVISEPMKFQKPEKIAQYCACVADSVSQQGVYRKWADNMEAVQWYLPYLKHCSDADGGVSVDSLVLELL